MLAQNILIFQLSVTQAEATLVVMNKKYDKVDSILCIKYTVLKWKYLPEDLTFEGRGRGEGPAGLRAHAGLRPPAVSAAGGGSAAQRAATPPAPPPAARTPSPGLSQ